MESVLWFDAAGSGFAPRFNVRDTLQLDAVNSLYVWTQRDGTVTSPGAASGPVPACRSFGGRAERSWVGALSCRRERAAEPLQGSATENDRDPGLHNAFSVDDNPSAALPNLTSILLRRSTDGGTTWKNVAQVTYTYYDGTTNFGAAGDLQTVTSANWNGSGWSDTGTTMYRYCRSGATSSSGAARTATR